MKNCELRAVRNSWHDSLTGLPNRALFYERLSQALTLARRNEMIIAVLFIRVDNVKIINDTLGRNCGDLLLKAIARQIRSCLRKSDTVARPGRDEFMVMLPEIAYADDAAVVARKIFASLEAPFTVEKHELLLSVSIGISIFPNDGSDAATLIKNSYAAMTRAVEAERNGYKFYSHNMNEKAFKRMMMENSLRLALRRQEFFLHYQPQIDLRTGMTSGMEALVRWRKPGFGVVCPGDFIQFMEERDLIVLLGEWVLKNACIQNKRWQDAGLRPVRVSANLSARQFHECDIVRTVSRVLDETKLDPAHLELEVTEGIFMRNTETTIEALRALRSMGVNLSIDDFGTGYSALCYIKYFPVSRLKIVAPFTSSFAIDSNEAIVASAIVSMAHSLNIKVIAEGVEKAEDLDFIFSLKCDEVQGNIFSSAISPEEGRGFLYEEKLFSPLLVNA